MLVPEAAVHKHRFPPAREHDVWCAGQTFDMEPIAISHPPKGAPDNPFRCRVPAPYASHSLAEASGTGLSGFGHGGKLDMGVHALLNLLLPASNKLLKAFEKLVGGRPKTGLTLVNLSAPECVPGVSPNYMRLN